MKNKRGCPKSKIGQPLWVGLLFLSFSAPAQPPLTTTEVYTGNADTTTTDGGLFLLFSISGDFGFSNLPAIETPHNMEYGLVLVKTAPSGEAIWMKLFPGTGYFEGVKVLAMSTGDALVCANYTSPVTVNDTLMGSKGNMETALLLLHRLKTCFFNLWPSE